MPSKAPNNTNIPIINNPIVLRDTGDFLLCILLIIKNPAINPRTHIIKKSRCTIAPNIVIAPVIIYNNNVMLDVLTSRK